MPRNLGYGRQVSAVLGAVQTQKERTTLDAKDLNQTKDTDGGTEGKHMASSPTVQLRKGQHFSGDTRQMLVRYWCCPGAADGLYNQPYCL